MEPYQQLELSLRHAMPSKCWNTYLVRCAAGDKWLCDVIMLAPIVHIDSDDRKCYHVICTHRTRGFLGALTHLAVTVLSCNQKSEP